ncbi:MAG: ArnT family glycosyltransferase [Planctomycetota bacterium]|jgi:hypothetical protein
MDHEPPPRAPEEATPERPPGDRGWLVALFLAAFAARLTAALQTRVINPDGVEFTRIAAAFHAGDIQTGLAHPHHPLYPFLVSLARWIAGDWTASASMVSMIFGALCVLPLFFLFRAVWSRRVALFGCAVFVFLPPFVRFGADAITETTFHFFFLSALALAYHAQQTRILPHALLGGLSAAGAYLTRPEGAGLPLAVGAWALLCAVRDKGRAKKALLGGSVFCIAFLVFSAPYLLHVRSETGRIALTKKKPLENLLGTYKGEHTAGAEPGRKTDLPRTSTLPGTLARTGQALSASLFHIPLVFILLGLLLRGRERSFLDEAFLLTPILLWLALGAVLARSHGYVSHRHVSPASLLLLGYAGLGAAGLARILARVAVKRAGRGSVERIETWILVGCALLPIVLGATTAFRAYRVGKIHVIDIGRELKDVHGPGRVIVGNRIRIAYYASGRHHDVPPFHDLPSVASFLLDRGAHLFVIDVLDSHFALRHAALVPRFTEAEAPPPGFVFLKRWRIGKETGRERDIRAYRIDPEALRGWLKAVPREEGGED